jgi:hypothetical protein
LRRFELGRRDGSRRFSWLTSAGLHAALILLAITVAWQAPRPQRETSVAAVRDWIVLPPVGMARPRPRPPAVVPPSPPQPPRVAVDRQPLAAQEVAPLVLRTPDRIERAKATADFAAGPQLGDGRPWVSPRPALPAVVAEALYGKRDTTLEDVKVQRRLRSMLDSLNQLMDMQQRGGRRPTWSTDIAGVPFGIDSQFINIAGIKVPTMALALLGNLLPPGNYDVNHQAQQFEDMRQDMLRAAQRTETFRDFQKYVKELRARKQMERDTARARQATPDQPPADTTRVIP